jgi:hypothetical protein
MDYTEVEIELIAKAKSDGGNVWDNPSLATIKRKIKDYYRAKNNEQCCYCRRDFENEFNMVIDIEHILPKSIVEFSNYMFEIENLNISCKRCNMNIKKDRIDFIVDMATINPDYKVSQKYLFIHPNFDDYFDNIDYDMIIKNNKKLIKYTSKTEKGKYTYSYFYLDKIEIDTLNSAQGIDVKINDLNLDIPDSIKDSLEDLLSKV